MLSFSEAVAYELAPHGVSVTCYCPGATATEFAARSGNEKSLLFRQPGVARADEVAEDAFERMMEGDVVAVHGALNWVLTQAVRLSPRAVLRKIAATLNLPPSP